MNGATQEMMKDGLINSTFTSETASNKPTDKYKFMISLYSHVHYTNGIVDQMELILASGHHLVLEELLCWMLK